MGLQVAMQGSRVLMVRWAPRVPMVSPAIKVKPAKLARRERKANWDQKVHRVRLVFLESQVLAATWARRVLAAKLVHEA
jgi:hypothetical protein